MIDTLETTPQAHPTARAGTCRRGSALVVVFWIMAILALAVFAAVRVVYMDADIATAQLNGFDAFLAAERGVAVASNPAIKRTDPLLEWSDQENDLSYKVQITSEASRFNINVILLRKDKQLLLDLFASWGMEFDDAQMLVDNLTDWVDGGDLAELNGAEVDWYEAQGRPNHPFNRPFYNLDEMRLVKDMNLLEQVNPAWRKWFTVWSLGKLDINEAEPELIAVAANVSIEKARDFVDVVKGPDLIRDTEDDQRFHDLTAALNLLGVSEYSMPIVRPRFTVNDKTVRIVSDGRAGNIRRRIILVLKNKKGKPIILERKEKILPALINP